MLDAALINAAQAAEHYEITRYGSLIAWAKQLGRNDCASVLQKTLDEEKATDKKLTALAESKVNLRAAAARNIKSYNETRVDPADPAARIVRAAFLVNLQGSLFDHPVGAQHQPRRNFVADRLGGLEIDHQFEVRGLLHRQVGRFGAAQHLDDLARSLPVHLCERRTIADQAAEIRRLRPLIDCRQGDLRHLIED